jgi:hypothetical protein
MTTPTTEQRRVFLNAWQTWDDASDRFAAKNVRTNERSLKAQAAEMERTAGDYASILGMRTTPFRELLATLRRCGYTRPDAVRAVELVIAELGSR